MERLNSDLVFSYAKKAKTFSTRDVAVKFKASFMQAAAAIAVLRGRNKIYPGNPSKDLDGISLWTIRAPKH